MYGWVIFNVNLSLNQVSMSISQSSYLIRRPQPSFCPVPNSFEKTQNAKSILTLINMVQEIESTTNPLLNQFVYAPALLGPVQQFLSFPRGSML